MKSQKGNQASTKLMTGWLKIYISGCFLDTSIKSAYLGWVPQAQGGRGTRLLTGGSSPSIPQWYAPVQVELKTGVNMNGDDKCRCRLQYPMEHSILCC